MTWANKYIDGVLGTCLRVFGETVTYEPAAGGSHAISGIYNEIYQEVDPNSGAIVQSNKPNLGIRLSDLPAKPAPGDKVTVRTVVFRVKESQVDGEGGAVLLLHKN